MKVLILIFKSWKFDISNYISSILCCKNYRKLLLKFFLHSLGFENNKQNLMYLWIIKSTELEENT